MSDWTDDTTKRPGTHCIGGLVGLGAGLDSCGKYRPHWDSIPCTVQLVASLYTDWDIPPLTLVISYNIIRSPWIWPCRAETCMREKERNFVLVFILWTVVSIQLLYTYIYIYTYTHMYIRTYIYTYIHTYTYRYTYIRTSMHAYIHTYVYIHTYIYIYTYIQGVWVSVVVKALRY